MIQFTGERIVPEADNCEPLFAEKMYQEHIARYAFASQWIHGKRVLDVGCGVGYGSRWMAQNGAASVHAFDLSCDAIGHAKLFYANEKVTFEVASATAFDFSEKFDVVTCFELIEHVDAQRDVIKCIRRALKDDGVLIISTPRALAEKRTHFHTKEFSEQDFRELLGQSFPQVSFYFENNHFCSLITNDEPKRVDQILTLKDQFTLSQADYFIAVASVSEDRAISKDIGSVLVLGDDKYVALLERDVSILHNAEERLIKEWNLEKVENETLKVENETLKAEVAQIRLCVEQERRDSEYLKNFIAETRASLSWRLTAPLRYISGKLRQPMRILRKVRAYQKARGTRALASAIRRRLGAHGLHVLHTAASNVPVTDAKTLVNQQFDVIFCIGCWEGESKRYRVYNLAEGLERMGFRVHVMPYQNVAKLAQNNVIASSVVLFRAPYDLAIECDIFLSYAKMMGIKVVFDVDDLVFEPEIVEQIDGFKMLSHTEQSQYIDGVHRYRELLLAADLVTVPTAYLRERVERLGKSAAVIPNSINYAQLELAAELANQPKEPREVVRIGYFSGSHTHQADFAQCADALLRVMSDFSQVEFRIVGFLDLDGRWDSMRDRIERLGFQPYKSMLRTLSECDINIAPLDLSSIFCHGKSELKFFEAGLLGIPTIASATDTYQRVIEDGVNGLLVRSSNEWVVALQKLVKAPELRTEIGAKARETAMHRFAIQAVATTASKIYGLELIPKAKGPVAVSQPAVNQLSTLKSGKLHISWVIPGLIIGGGGHRNILRAAYFLTQFGHQVSLYFIGTEKDPEVIKRQIQQHFYPINCAVHLFEGKIYPCDVVFATHWSTVSAAMTARGIAKDIMYFVQDFEPAFSPMGSEYVLAENTYRQGLYHITSGPWCELMLRRDFNAVADHFQFPVDRSIYYPRVRTKANRNLVFFAKPEMPRRCFELGTMALQEFHQLRPDVEIVMFGSKHASKQSYDFPVTIREVLPTLNDLAQMYSDGDVGLVFSTTNPSLIPYEMMACGLPVIDLARGDNAINYAGRTDIALLADPQPHIMARQIAELIGNPVELIDRRENGLDFVNSFPSEEGMARRIEDLIMRRLEGFASK